MAIPVDECKLRIIAFCNEKDNGNALKRARILFDEDHPNGAPLGVLSINNTQLCKQSSSANYQHSANVRIQQSVILDCNISPSNRSLTNLRIAPIMNNAKSHGPNFTEGNVTIQATEQSDEYDDEVYKSEEESFDKDELEENSDQL